MDIQKRIDELKKELQMHQNKANQARQIINIETQQILAKQGALFELQKLIKTEPKIEKSKKKK